LPPDTYILGQGKEPLTTSKYNRMWANFWHKYGHATELCYKSKTKLSNGKIKQYIHKEWRADVCAHQFRHEYVCMLADANMKMIHEVYIWHAALDALIFSPTTPTKTPT
jgi:hypothetical protein